MLAELHARQRVGHHQRQQQGPGRSIPWGVYPSQPAVRYQVDVHMNNLKVDGKDQTYPPHGSVNAKDVVSGGLFRLEGRTYNAKGDVGIFYLSCTAA